MFVSSTEQQILSGSFLNKMPSYFDRRTIGSSHSSHHPMPSGHHDIGVPAHFTSVGPPQHRGKGQNQSRKPSVTPQGFMGCGHDNIGGPNPPPPKHIYDDPSFRCTRCGHPFTSQAELCHHSVVCGAAALLTGMFTPYSAQQNDQHQKPQLHPPAPHGAGDYHQTQYQNHNQYRRA